MEAKMVPNDIAPIETATPVGMSDTAGLAGTTSLAMGGRVRGRLISGWHFTRHLVEMVVAMLAGMAVLGVAVAALGALPGSDQPLIEYGLMGAAMSASMVAWMRYRGHSWSDGMEMTLAMLVPMFALVLLLEPGAAGNETEQSDHALMMLAHVAMVAGMIALMICRSDRYVHGTHGRRT